MVKGYRLKGLKLNVNQDYTPIAKNQVNSAGTMKGFLLCAQNLAVNPVNNSKGFNLSGVTVVSL